MSFSTIAALAGIAMLVLLVLGMPIAFALGATGLFTLMHIAPGSGWMTFTSGAGIEHLANFGFMAIPLFVLMSAYITESGIGRDLIDVSTKWLSRLPGHLHSASILACGGFSAMSGSSIATAAAIGGVILPEIKRRGHSITLGMGGIAAGGTLGMLIPPSNAFIVYGVLTETSISKLFMAGVVPGLILIVCFIVFNTVVFSLFPGLNSHAAREEKYTWADRLNSLRKIWTALVLILTVIGGIFFGIVTPTEAAAAGALVALLLAVFVMRGLTFRTAHRAAIRAVHVTAMLGLIILGGLILGRAMTLLNISNNLITWLDSSGFEPWVVILLINLLLVGLGLLMDAAAIMLIAVPLLFPVVMKLGFDPIWFGVVFCINMELALITPPVGMNLFVIKGITGEPMRKVILGVLPYALIVVMVLVLVIVFPPLATWLPGTMQTRS